MLNHLAVQTANPWTWRKMSHHFYYQRYHSITISKLRGVDQAAKSSPCWPKHDILWYEQCHQYSNRTSSKRDEFIHQSFNLLHLHEGCLVCATCFNHNYRVFHPGGCYYSYYHHCRCHSCLSIYCLLLHLFLFYILSRRGRCNLYHGVYYNLVTHNRLHNWTNPIAVPNVATACGRPCPTLLQFFILFSLPIPPFSLRRRPLLHGRSDGYYMKEGHK